MGIVYRADDLRLGHPIALKFIPQELAADTSTLTYLYAEVRNARQIAHPNVCRVYDIGEHEGRHFLTMEYVDGEDLASLLKRIGRLPSQKAMELSSQICAGLGAAHYQNIIHRDLKPANIMIDGRGQARIMDFGLSFKEGEKDRAEELAGTLAYMAPEQWADRTTTMKSDIYSLGLVLYELWSGSRAIEAETAEELQQKQLEETPRPLSSHSPGIDPGIDRLVLQCLSKDPDSRPSSALDVAAALPGGDPVKAAIAAGQTPTPEMIAATGGEGSLKPAIAWGLLGLFFALLAAAVILAPRSVIMGTPTFQKSPDVLAETARTIIQDAGYTTMPKDRVYWFEADEDMIDWLPSVSSEQPLNTRVVRFRYRESPRSLIPYGYQGYIKEANPAWNVPGMKSVDLDPQGRLIRFMAIPGPMETVPDNTPTDWKAIFAASRLNLLSLEIITPSYIPFVPFDQLNAWKGEIEDSPGILCNVLAASYQGLPVYFEIKGPWSQHQINATNKWTRKIIPTIWFSAVLMVFFIGIYFANRNIRMRRGDARGAFRISLFGFLTLALSHILWSHHAYASGGDFMWWIRGGIAFFLFDALYIWVVYVAAEPAIRRFLPEGMVSWNRLISGRIRDPLVGRDILIGATIGAALTCTLFLLRTLPGWMSLPGTWSAHVELQSVLGSPSQVGMFIHLLGIAAFYSVGWIAAFVFASVIFKKKWIVWINFVFFGSVYAMVDMGGDFWIQAIFALLSSLVLATVLFRYGIFTITAGFFFFNFLARMPLRMDMRFWPARGAMLTLAIIIVIVCYGFYISLGKRSLFGQIQAD